MDEELLKPNTDCVYFLASPLTCKKGMECEYRHNEIARLNPRDCWYWLNAYCLNPDCAFRHPPLEKHAEEPSEQTSSYQSSDSTNKRGVPCYFYYSSFCNKGDKCSFSHGFNGNAPSTTSAKTPSTVSNVASGTAGMAESTEVHMTPLTTAPKVVLDLKFQTKEDLVPLSVLKHLKSKSYNFQADVHPCDEGAILESDASPPAEGNTENNSPVCSDQSLQEQVDGHDEPEERLESSPGFDVLVDHILDTVVYEDEEEYLPSLDGENRELTNHLGFHFENSLEYDPRYLDGLLHESDMYGSFDSVDGFPVFDGENQNSGYPRSRMLDSLKSRKRKPVDSKINGLRGVDLRERLTKRRLVDDNQFVSRSSRRRASPYLRSQSQERFQQHSVSTQLHGRMASDVGIESGRGNWFVSNFGHSRHSGQHGIYDSNRTKLLYEGRRHVKNRMFNRASAGFTGPKTYHQIKEEKNKDGQWTDKNSRRTESRDFEGPKPLSEILKYKRKLRSVVGTNSDDFN